MDHSSLTIIFPSLHRRFWITMAASAIIYLPSLFWTLGLDQNIFAEIGSLLLKGKTLYLDAWDVKPPNIFYVYAFFESIFGAHDFAIRCSDYLFTLGASAAIFFATERQSAMLAGKGREWIAPLATLLFILTALSLGLADTAQTESYSLAFIIGASILAQPVSGQERNCPWTSIVSGIAIAIAVFFKTSNALFLLAIAAEILIYDSVRRSRALAFFLTGFFGWCFFQVLILGITGSLSEYIRIASSVLLHHTNEVSQFGLTDIPRALWTYLDLWTIFSIIAIFIAIIRRDMHFLRSAVSPLLLLAAGIGAVIIQNKGWGYHYVVALPGLARMCAISGTYLFRIIHNRARSVAIVLTIAVGIITLALTPSAHRRIHYIEDAVLSVKNHSRYLASLGSQHSLYYPPCSDSLANYLHSHTLPTDDVFIFGEEPGVYWRADRMPASRYIYSLLFTSGVIPDSDLVAMQDSIAARSPSIVAVERFDTTWFQEKPETSEMIVSMDSLFSPLKLLLENGYEVTDTLCSNFILYRCRTNSSRP